MFLLTDTKEPNEPDHAPNKFVKIPESTGLGCCEILNCKCSLVSVVVEPISNVPNFLAPVFPTANIVKVSLPLPVLYCC